MQKGKSQSTFTFSIPRLVFFITLVCLLLFSLNYSSQIETIINVGYTTQSGTLDEAGLQVHFVNVGQADATIIEFPDGKTMIVDTGASAASGVLIDYINNNIFENNNSFVFDYMVLTHSHADHVGGAVAVLEAYQVNTVYRPEIYATYDDFEVLPQGRAFSNKQTYKRAIEKVYEEPDCQVLFSFSGLSITGGTGGDAYTVTFLSPLSHYYSDENAFSPIMLLYYKGKSIMLTGDALAVNEQEVMAEFLLSEVDVLKVAHHGGNTSSTSEFLAQIMPTYAVISVGKNNIYNHPHQQVINRLLYAGVAENNILRTDLHGNILANVTTQGQLIMFLQVESLPTYIKWEYAVIILICIGAALCFWNESKQM